MTKKPILQFTAHLINGLSDSRIILKDKLYFDKLDYQRNSIHCSMDFVKIERHLMCTFIPMNIPRFPKELLEEYEEVAAANIKVVMASTKDGYPPIITAAADFRIPVRPTVTLRKIAQWEVLYYALEEAVHWQWDFDFPIVPTPIESLPSINTFDNSYIVFHGIKA